MREANDSIAIIEQAYRMELDDRAWLREVAHAAAPLIDCGMGSFAFFYEASTCTHWQLGEVVNLGAPGEISAILRDAAPLSPPEMTRRFYWSRPCTPVLELLADSAEAAFLESVIRPSGAVDVLMIKAADPTGPAVGLCAPMPKRRSIARSTVSSWNRIAAHLAAAHRLRRALRTTGLQRDAAAGADAIFDPSGRCEHATGSARAPDCRAALRHAAIAIDRARGKLRRDDAAAAIELWKGLIDGRWSLIEHFEQDGRRYVVARRNDPQTRDPRALSARERQIAHLVALGHSNKLAAYELGISAASVATHLRRAAVKLGVQSRVALIARLRASVEGHLNDHGGDGNETSP